MDINNILHMLDNGFSLREISRQLHTPYTSLIRLTRKYFTGCLIDKRFAVLCTKARILKSMGIKHKEAADYLKVSVRTYYRLLGRRLRAGSSIGIPIRLTIPITNQDTKMVIEGLYLVSYFTPITLILRAGDVHFVNTKDVVGHVELLKDERGGCGNG